MGCLDEGHLNVEIESVVSNGVVGLGQEYEANTIAIENAVKVLLLALGEDVNREGIRKMSHRVAKALHEGTREPLGHWGIHTRMETMIGLIKVSVAASEERVAMQFSLIQIREQNDKILQLFRERLPGKPQSPLQSPPRPSRQLPEAEVDTAVVESEGQANNGFPWGASNPMDTILDIVGRNPVVGAQQKQEKEMGPTGNPTGEDKDTSWVRDEGEEELRKLTDADMDEQSIADYAFQSQKCDPTLVVVDQLIKLHGFFIVTARDWLIKGTLWGEMFKMAATKLKVQIPQFHLEDKVSLEAVGNDGTIVGDIMDSGALLWAISSGVWTRSSGSSLFKGG